MDKTAVQQTLNRIMEFELAGVVRYTHYALMVYGYNRIPIVARMLAGERVTDTTRRQARELLAAPSGRAHS